MKVPIYNQNADVVGEADLNPKIFEVKPSLHLMAESVRVQQANARRVVACVDACAGLSTEELEYVGLGGIKGLIGYGRPPVLKGGAE